jgi:hypothetical protein
MKAAVAEALEIPMLGICARTQGWPDIAPVEYALGSPLALPYCFPSSSQHTSNTDCTASASKGKAQMIAILKPLRFRGAECVDILGLEANGIS